MTGFEYYPEDTRKALDAFCLYEAQGEFFDIRVPSNIIREAIAQNHCLHCGRCAETCPKQIIEKRG